MELQLTPFRTIALERFTGTEAEALSKLAFQVKNIASTLSALQNYSDAAKLNIFGLPSNITASGGVEITSPLSKLLQGCYTSTGNGVTALCTTEAEKKFLEAIDRFPDFPFSYFALAGCYKAQGETK